MAGPMLTAGSGEKHRVTRSSGPNLGWKDPPGISPHKGCGRYLRTMETEHAQRFSDSLSLLLCDSK